MSEHIHDDCVHCLRRDNERLRKELAEAREQHYGPGIPAQLVPLQLWLRRLMAEARR